LDLTTFSEKCHLVGVLGKNFRVFQAVPPQTHEAQKGGKEILEAPLKLYVVFVRSVTLWVKKN